MASGRATFVLGDEEIDAPAGTFIHAEPGTKRGAVATEPNTTVLAIGAKPGVPHEISAWEEIFVAFGLYRSGDEAGAREHMARVRRRAAGRLAGPLQRRLPRGADEEPRCSAIEHLRRAIELDPQAKEYAAEGRGLRLAARRPGVPGMSGTREHLRPRAPARRRAVLGDGANALRHPGVRRQRVHRRGARDQVIGDHDELGERAGRHEELYFVSSGHATFTVNGDEIDAPAGTFVFVRDPAAKRSAVAEEAGTTIVIVGGKPGEAFSPSPWERNAEGLVHFANEDYEQAAETYEQLLAETPRRRRLPLQPRLRREPPGPQGARRSSTCASAVEAEREVQARRRQGPRLRRDPRRPGVLSDHRAGGRRRRGLVAPAPGRPRAARRAARRR